MDNITDKFIDSLYPITQKPISDDVMSCIKKCFIDYLGATIGGAAISEDKVEQLLSVFETDGHYSLIGFKDKTSLQTALLINGISSHMAELDDGVISGIIHPGAPIFTALLSVAEKEQVNWNQFAMGVLIGYESSVLLANSIQPSHKKCGYHASGTCGTVGVALAVGAMLGFDKATMKEALTIAMASAHGTLKVLEDASELKPYNISSAAINGVIAAYMAKSGFHGANDPFVGEAGFISQMTNEFDINKLIRKPVDKFSIEDVYFKPYAACRYCHPSIEASMYLKNQYNINCKEVEKIQIETYSLAVKHHDHTTIPNISSAKMSIPYSAAVSLVNGSGNIDSYTLKNINNDEVLALTKKVTVSANDEFSALFPQKSCARMTITTMGGHSYTTIVDMPKGEPSNPMSYQDLKDKFISLSTFAGKDENFANELLNIVESEDVDVRLLIDKIC